MKKLTGNRNQCRACGQYFNSNGAFDKHRTGEFDLNRRCRTAQEMVDIGMVLRPDGFWIREPMKGFMENENDTL